MRIFKILIGLAIIATIQSCGGTSSTTKVQDQGETEFKAGNYEAALNFYEPTITAKESKGKKAKGHIYVGAGKSAYELNQIEKSRTYLESARAVQYSSADMYEYLAKVYKNIDNLSKEITALELYHEKFPKGENIQKIDARLMATYVESENWDLGHKLWVSIDSTSRTNTDLLENYLLINKGVNNTAECDKLAKLITKQEPNNVVVMEYYAEKYFWIAEDMYVKEMKAYKKKRTNSQYKKLLKALDKVWPNFKKSRDLYLKLYKIDPKPEYADYLSRIYTRYDDKQKAAYYKKRAK